MNHFLSRLAVCSWSLQPDSPQDLADKLRAVGILNAQIDLDPFRDQPDVWDSAAGVFKEEGIRLVSGMFRCEGEDYTTPETIRVTGGVVPDETWEVNWERAQANVINAERLGLEFVMFHAGFLPHDPADPTFDKLVDRLRQLARLYGKYGIALGFETGQETAEALKIFLRHLGERNVFINFDPANMILYNNGDPIEALQAVGRQVRGVHLKDANVTQVRGEWGEELPVGIGQVDWKAFFNELADAKYEGWLCFEREAGETRVEDIRSGRLFVEDLLRSPASR
jgi:sugar phosphate isomerase/epimerase